MKSENSVQTAPGADGNVPTVDQTFLDLVLAQQQSRGRVVETLLLPKFGASENKLVIFVADMRALHLYVCLIMCR